VEAIGSGIEVRVGDLSPRSGVDPLVAEPFQHVAEAHFDADERLMAP
jgi:hypothetical protein